MTDTNSDALHIKRLTIDNTMRIEAVDIELNDDNLVVIGGPNGAGKTSVLQSIALALGGAKTREIPQPVRAGADEGNIVVDLGSLVVHRRFTASGKTVLEVRTADGRKLASAASTLAEFRGMTLYDPLRLLNLSPKEQVQALLELVDLDFDLDATNKHRAELFEQRTVIGRDRDRAAAAASEAVVTDPPDQPADTAALMAELAERRKAHDTHAARNRELDGLRGETAKLEAVNAQIETDIDAMRAQIVELEQKIVARSAEHGANTAEIARINDQVADLAVVITVDGASLPDLHELEQQLAEAGEINARWEAHKHWVALNTEAETKAAEYRAKTVELDEIDKKKREAIMAAKMPYDGLSFDDDNVYLHDVPLVQASTAQKLTACLAIGMASNPKIRVMLIPDASLLDSDSLALVHRIAVANNYQVWLERVGDLDGGFIIEDGNVVSWPDSHFDDNTDDAVAANDVEP